MRSHLVRRSFASALLAGALTLLVVPSVAAQTAPDPWAGSTITSPGSSESSSDVLLAGVFKHNAGHIREVRLEIGRKGDGGGFTAADGECVPTDPGAVPDSDGNTSFRNASYAFSRTATFSCNGAFALRATPVITFGVNEPPLVRTFDVAVPPAPVSGMAATLDPEDQPSTKTGATADDPASVVVTWDSLEDRYPHDFRGYRVTRTGPGDQGTVDVSGMLGASATSFTDRVEAPGRYTYTVDSFRDAPGGPVSSAGGSPTAEIRVAGPAATSTTSTPGDEDGDSDVSGLTRQRDGGSVTIPRISGGVNLPTTQRRSGITTPRTPGTIDTGFEQELDYGDRSDGTEPGDEQALAGEGQSVIRTDDDGPGLLGPAAGALVLLGWAGHVAYLNRLAKEF